MSIRESSPAYTACKRALGMMTSEQRAATTVKRLMAAYGVTPAEAERAMRECGG